jgi:hypothetical protein
MIQHDVARDAGCAVIRQERFFEKPAAYAA